LVLRETQRIIQRSAGEMEETAVRALVESLIQSHTSKMGSEIEGVYLQVTSGGPWFSYPGSGKAL
jgi:hypothetical protein